MIGKQIEEIMKSNRFFRVSVEPGHPAIHHLCEKNKLMKQVGIRKVCEIKAADGSLPFKDIEEKHEVISIL